MTPVPADLDPSTEQARQWFRDELARSDYHDTRSLFQRLMDWLGGWLADLQSAQGNGGVSLPPIVITVVVLLLAVGVGYLLTRIRVENGAVREDRTVLGDTAMDAEQLRTEAQRAFGQGRFGDAVLAWTRALARDAEQRTLLQGAPSMTAHEVGTALASVFAGHADLIHRATDLFDAVAYGRYEATRDDAALVRDADATLRSARLVLVTAHAPGTGPAHGPPEAPAASGSAAEEQPGSVWLTGVRS